jgi:hypothetical protein
VERVSAGAVETTETVFSRSEGAATAVLLADARTLIVEWHNDLAVELLPPERRGESLIGRPVGEIMTLASAAGVAQAIDGVVATGRPFHLTLRVISPLPEHYTLKVSAYLLPSEKLLFLGTVC